MLVDAAVGFVCKGGGRISISMDSVHGVIDKLSVVSGSLMEIMEDDLSGTARSDLTLLRS